MKIEIIDPRKEWPDSYDHLLRKQAEKDGGMIINFSADTNIPKESLALRAFRAEADALLKIMSGKINIKIIHEIYSGDQLRQNLIIFQIYSVNNQESYTEPFTMIAALLAVFGKYYKPTELLKPEPPPIRIIKEGEDEATTFKKN